MTSRSTSAINYRAELAHANYTASFFRAAAPDFAAAHGIELHEHPAYLAALVTKSPALQHQSNVARLGSNAPATPADIDHLFDLCKNTQVAVRFSPDARPADLGRQLSERGLRVEDNNAKLFWRTTALAQPQSPFRLVAADARTIHDFARISCNGLSDLLKQWLAQTYAVPGWQHYLAYLGAEPIASGAIYIQDGMGHLGWAATLPEYRRQGAQTALLIHRMREAVRLGCDLVCADTGEDTAQRPNPSYHNMLRVGFQLAYIRPRYVYHPHKLLCRNSP